MPFWNDNKWRIEGPVQKIVEPWDPSRVEDANYLLSIGSEVYVSDEASGKTARQLKDSESFVIDPGQFAFLLTEQAVNIPIGALGFISIRASIKFSGLVNISGFHVDPGYSGKLLFSVFNAGPSPIHLKRGEPIFPIWLADLNESISRKEMKKGYNDLPSKNINQISGKFTTAYQVEKHIDELREEINDLKAFKTQAVIVLTIAAALMIPLIKDSVSKVFQTPSTTSPMATGGATNLPAQPSSAGALTPAPAPTASPSALPIAPGSTSSPVPKSPPIKSP
jgi:dCTP deaminase